MCGLATLRPTHSNLPNYCEYEMGTKPNSTISFHVVLISKLQLGQIIVRLD